MLTAVFLLRFECFVVAPFIHRQIVLLQLTQIGVFVIIYATASPASIYDSALCFL